MKLILLLSTLLLSVLAAKAANDAVLDRDGKKLRAGVDYYIYPAFTDIAGGLTLASRNNTCPLNVIEANSPTEFGLPLTFTPVDPKKTTIRLSTDLNIAFSAATICVQSTVWKLGSDESTGLAYVTTGGVKGNPGRATLSNWFTIQKGEVDYKLVFCPTVCNICRPRCGDLGVIIEDGNRWLGLSEVPLPIRFIKA